MRKFILLLGSYAFVLTSVAQDEFVNRPADNPTALISTNGDADAGVYCADYFELTSDTTIESFYFPGRSSSGGPLGGDVTGVDFLIYEDAGDFPAGDPTQAGSALVELFNIQESSGGFEFTEDQGNPQDFTVNIVPAYGDFIYLPAGNYWVSFAPVVAGNSDGAGRWNWIGSVSAAPANEPLLIDPDDLFGAVATDWTNISGLIGADFPAFAWIGRQLKIGFDDVVLGGISLYPNPATTFVKLVNPNQIVIDSILLVSIDGKEMTSALNNGIIDISHLNAGVYLIRIETKFGVALKKLVVT